MSRVLTAILVLTLAIGVTILAWLTARPKLEGLINALGLAGLMNRLNLGASRIGLRLSAFWSRCRLRAASCLGRLSRSIGGFRLPNPAHGLAAVCSSVGSKLRQLAHRRRFAAFIRRLGLRIPAGANYCGPDERSRTQPDLGILNCRVRLTPPEKGSEGSAAFAVDVCGAIEAPADMHPATLRISIVDATDGDSRAVPVHARVKEWQAPDSPAFCYNADLGRLPHRVTTLTEWTTLAQLPIDWLVFPRKGERVFRFQVLVLSRQDGRELARAEYAAEVENTDYGYIDSEENVERSRILAVGLAFAVSASDYKLFNCEVDLIKNWAKDNIHLSNTSEKVVERKIEKALDKTVGFFRNGNHLDARRICEEIVKIAPVAERYDILDLCLHVAQTKGCATAEELAILKRLAEWLEVDPDRFRGMMERVLPVGIQEVTDTETLLGITADMSQEKARQHLNREYSKWNSRVTNSDPEVRRQADQMLRLIAEARRQYVAQDA